MEQVITDKRFDPKDICRTLIRQGLITKPQAKEVLKKKDRIRQKIEKRLHKERDAGSENGIPVTIIDVIAALNLLLVPFFYDAYQLPPEAWDFVPDGVTVVGMTPEINAYKDVYFKEWFYPAEIPEADYCIFFDSAIPCTTEECRAKKQEFRDMCRPLYERGDLGLVVGTTQRPSGEQE